MAMNLASGNGEQQLDVADIEIIKESTSVSVRRLQYSKGVRDMGLTTSYLTSIKNTEAIFHAIQGAKAPERFSQKFLETLEFKSNVDRLITPVLKGLGFLTSDGVPTERYFSYLDQTQGGRVLANAIEEAYSDLFQVNRNAQDLSKSEIQGKLKTLTQGKPSEGVLKNMAQTFKKLCSLADWTEAEKEETEESDMPEMPQPVPAPPGSPSTGHPTLKLDHLAYNIQIILPESRNPAVYDALFRSLKEHLLK